MSSPADLQELFRAQERSVEELLRNIRATHTAILRSMQTTDASKRRASSAEYEHYSATRPVTARASTVDGETSPAFRAVNFEPTPRLHSSMTMASDVFPGSTLRSRRLTNESDLLRPIEAVHRPISVSEMELDDDDDELLTQRSPFIQLTSIPGSTHVGQSSSYVRSPLRQFSYQMEHLGEHLARLDPEGETAEYSGALSQAFGGVYDNRRHLNPQSLQHYATRDDNAIYTQGVYEIYDIGKNGRIIDLSKRQNAQHDGFEALTVENAWNKLSDVNPKQLAVGRMTILKEPSPFILAGAHFALGQHFDMDELLQHLVTDDGNSGKTTAFVNRALEQSKLRQKSFFFVFKYHTVVGEEMTRAPWQQYDDRPQEKKRRDHIDIVECSSVLALSLEDDNPQAVEAKVPHRRRRPAPTGKVCDIFSPWHLLSLQYFPDAHHTFRSEDVNRTYFNGPYAFLHSLALEYRDAAKRYAQLNDLITRLITPKSRFLFDEKMRDELLFEDENFTYSRRYFWANSSLGVLNDGIKSMQKAYDESFTDEFWEGRHLTIWPHPKPASAEGKEYLDRMKRVRTELGSAVAALQSVKQKNERTQKEIGSLREQLFSGSSVNESRKAIEQGDNIKVLTSVSMIFLPLSFVISIFGINTMQLTVHDWEFPTVMVTVCVPFFLLVILLMTRRGMQAVRRLDGKLEEWAGYLPGFKPVEKRSARGNGGQYGDPHQQPGRPGLPRRVTTGHINGQDFGIGERDVASRKKERSKTTQPEAKALKDGTPMRQRRKKSRTWFFGSISTEKVPAVPPGTVGLEQVVVAGGQHRAEVAYLTVEESVPPKS